MVIRLRQPGQAASFPVACQSVELTRQMARFVPKFDQCFRMMALEAA
jgi:hypothetical protein